VIIKSHIRGGYRSAAQYMKDIGQNEETRIVQISDLDSKNLDEAFRNMWVIASSSKVKKPLHHVSINPFKEERLTDEQVLKIIERCEEKYGYIHGDHQRVIIEHFKEGRQHFHVMWNRVSLDTNKAVWPGEHWKKSKQAAREMEKALGLKNPVPRRVKQMQADAASRKQQAFGSYNNLNKPIKLPIAVKVGRNIATPPHPSTEPLIPVATTKGWPEAAIIDWETWGHKDPVRFFRLWSELAPSSFSPSG
jgi:hypothetical protein